MNLTLWQKLKAALLAALVAAGLAVPASGEQPAAGTAAPVFEEMTSAERLRQDLAEAIDDFEAAANEALDEFSQLDDDLCAEIAAQWSQGKRKDLVPADESSDESTESGDTLVFAVSIFKGPWSPPGLEEGQDLFFVYRLDTKGRWAPVAVCIRAGPKITTMKPERTQYGAFPKL